jgi:hypothetical protein
VPALALSKDTSLPSARVDTRQRERLCRVLTASSRQRVTASTAASPEFFLPTVTICRVSDTRQRGCLPSVPLCQVFDPRQIRPLPSASFAECGTRQRASLQSARASALGKARGTRQRSHLP